MALRQTIDMGDGKGGVWRLPDGEKDVAEVDIQRLPDGTRSVTYTHLIDNEEASGTVPATDTRSDETLANDVAMLQGKFTIPEFRRKM